jgi:hypothetical protein
MQSALSQVGLSVLATSLLLEHHGSVSYIRVLREGCWQPGLHFCRQECGPHDGENLRLGSLT